MDFYKRSQTIEKTRKSFTCKYCTDKKKMPHRFSCFNIVSCSVEEGISLLNDFLRPRANVESKSRRIHLK